MTHRDHSPWGQPAPEPRTQAPPPPAPPQSPYSPPPAGQISFGPRPYAGAPPPPPPYGYGGYPQPTSGANGLAIASLILAFVFCPAGLVCGILALAQMKKRPEPGRGLAIAGIVLSSVYLLLIAYGLSVVLST